MRRKSSKIIGLVLAIILCISMLPTTVFAMQLYVTVQTSGNSITIDVEPAYTIAQVKSKIEEKGYSIEQTELYYNNQLLEDSKTLADYNIQKEATLTLVSASYTITNAFFFSAGTLGISQDMLQWSNVNAPGGYKLEIYTESGKQVYSGILENNYTPASEVLTASGTYYFTVYALDANGNELSYKTSNTFTYTHTHSLTCVEVKDATCTENGNKEYWYCSGCGKFFSDYDATTEIDPVIEATGHSYEAVVTDPTCTAGGYTTYTCSVCGDTYTADETEATGHSYEAVVTDPTCTAGGYTTYTCSACGDSYTANETEATGHSWDEGTVAAAATCTEEGVKTYTCTVCGETKTEKIEAAGHSYEAVVTDPTARQEATPLTPALSVATLTQRMKPKQQVTAMKRL